MSTVLLTPSHHDLYTHGGDITITDGTLLTEDILRLPVYNLRKEPDDERMQTTIKSAFRALMALPDAISVRVSFEVHQHEGLPQYMTKGKRTWAELVLADDPSEVITRFSHHPDEDNEPYVSLWQWTKVKAWMNDDPSGQSAFYDEWMKEEAWTNLFMQFIQKSIDSADDEAKDLEKRARVCRARATIIEEARGPRLL